jgi:serine/threonine-protein kinase
MEISFSPPKGTLIVGKYRVEREIGSGGMGVVVEATHVALDQRVAIKLLDPSLASKPENVTRFLREARIAAKLPSEHIARVNDVGQTEHGAPYLVMELLEGHDLSTELVRRGRLRLTEAIDYVLQACEGIAEAHAVGLVHRDLKPANLFLSQRSNRTPIVKVLDFGLSKEPLMGSSKALTTTGSVFGTPQYMSPEQFESAKNVDARCDQHAMAMILYELLTGEPAYDGDSLTQLILAISQNPPPHVSERCPEAPPELDRAIVRALAKRAGDRFPDLSQFTDAISLFGGPSAREMAQNIRTTLGVRADAGVAAVSAPNLAASAAPTPIAALAPTQPAWHGGAAANPRAELVRSTGDLTSSVDPVKRVRRSQRRALAGAIAAALAVLTVAVGFLLWTRRPDRSLAVTVPSTQSGSEHAASIPSARERAAPSAAMEEPSVTPAPVEQNPAGAPPGSAAAEAPTGSSPRGAGAGAAPSAGPVRTVRRPAGPPTKKRPPNDTMERFD